MTNFDGKSKKVFAKSKKLILLVEIALIMAISFVVFASNIFGNLIKYVDSILTRTNCSSMESLILQQNIFFDKLFQFIWFLKPLLVMFKFFVALFIVVQMVILFSEDVQECPSKRLSFVMKKNSFTKCSSHVYIFLSKFLC